jgi:hypothetical protein
MGRIPCSRHHGEGSQEPRPLAEVIDTAALGDPFASGATCSKLAAMELFVPVLIGMTLIWLIGRGVPWDSKMMTIAVTLAVIILIVALERGGYWPEVFSRR